MSDRLLVLAPLRVEALAARVGARGARVVRTGMGPAAARRAAERAASMPAERVAIVGVCGALDPQLRPGDLVVATELLGTDADTALDDPEPLAEALSRRGLRVHLGPIVTTDHLISGEARAQAYAGGAIAADLESGWLAAGAAGRPLSVVRAVADTPSRELSVSIATARDGIAALRSLARALAVIEEGLVTA